MTTQLQPILKPDKVPPANEGHVTALSADERLLRKAVDRCLKAQVAEVLERLTGGAVMKGGPGSGNFGHEGRPGEVGGSRPGSGGGGGVKVPVYVKPFVSKIPREHLNIAHIKVEEKCPVGEAFYHAGIIHVDKSLFFVHKFADSSEGAAYYNAHPKEEVNSGSIYSTRYELPDHGEVTKEYAEHVIAHEVGHAVYSQMSEKQVDRAARLFAKVATPTIVSYASYVSERRDQYEGVGLNRNASVLNRKVAREQFAEAYRLHVLRGKFDREFRSLDVLKASKKSIDIPSAVPSNLTKWDQAVMREVRPIWFGLFKKGGDKALKEIRRFPRYARKMAVLSWAEMEARRLVAMGES